MHTHFSVNASWKIQCLLKLCKKMSFSVIFCYDLLLFSHFSRVRLFSTPWTVALQAPLYLGFSSQEFWSGLPFRTLGDLADPGIKPECLASPALAGGFLNTETPGKPKLGFRIR